MPGCGVQKTMPKLSLYHYSSCFYCHRVRKALKATGVYAELRDIREHLHWRAELAGARGRRTVPVLRIEEDDGQVRWMGESKDIVRYLHTLQAGGKRQQL